MKKRTNIKKAKAVKETQDVPVPPLDPRLAFVDTAEVCAKTIMSRAESPTAIVIQVHYASGLIARHRHIGAGFNNFSGIGGLEFEKQILINDFMKG